MKILVTGGAGFIGSHIVDKLVQDNHYVIVIDDLSTGNILNINRNSKFYKEDITNTDLYKIFDKERPDYVIHQAAQINVEKSLKDPLFDAYVNIIGTINILECCRKYGIKKIVYASSAAVYGEPEYLGIDEIHKIKPISNYGISKYTAESYLKVYKKLYNLEYTVLRYSNVYGVRQDTKGEAGVVAIFINRMLSKKPVIIFGNGEQTRDFVYVDDVARSNILALEYGNGEVINIGTGIKSSINKIYRLIENIVNTGKKPKYKEYRSGDIMDSYFDISKASNSLCFKPRYSLKEGLEDSIEYYKSQL